MRETDSTVLQSCSDAFIWGVWSVIIVRKKKSRKSTESERTLDWFKCVRCVQHNKFHAFLILKKVFTTKAANKDKEYI